jgi:hypothetical protein
MEVSVETSDVETARQSVAALRNESVKKTGSLLPESRSRSLEWRRRS